MSERFAKSLSILLLILIVPFIAWNVNQNQLESEQKEEQIGTDLDFASMGEDPPISQTINKHAAQTSPTDFSKTLELFRQELELESELASQTDDAKKAEIAAKIQTIKQSRLAVYQKGK